jgi:hypothetical protein
VSGDVRGKLIVDEIVAYWLRPAVELGDDDDAVYSLRTILDARETVFGRGLDCSWALMGCCGGLLRPGLVSFPLFSFFKFCFYIFWFLFGI